ncbi:MAG: ATP synthase F1 subunit gamma [Candidatus Omnitrophica bacterium]|nr:ATP synthase F1 subunit gamma [Candidatus Omnitrophota bacterium]
MAQSLCRIKARIRSIENTRKITSAMEMVSVAKLNRILDAQSAAAPYAQKLEEVFANALGSHSRARHPLLDARVAVRRVGLCVVTSDNGLCGAYNMTIIRAAEDFIRQRAATPAHVLAVGKKGAKYFKKNWPAVTGQCWSGFNGRYAPHVIDEISGRLRELFLTEAVDEMYVLSGAFGTGITYTTRLVKLFPISPQRRSPREYLFEPDPEKIFAKAIGWYVQVKVRSLILEALRVEHSARSVAMKTATDNARELLVRLMLQRNKIRQATITQEIIEIISSAEALKG